MAIMVVLQLPPMLSSRILVSLLFLSHSKKRCLPVCMRLMNSRADHGHHCGVADAGKRTLISVLLLSHGRAKLLRSHFVILHMHLVHSRQKFKVIAS